MISGEPHDYAASPEPVSLRRTKAPAVHLIRQWHIGTLCGARGNNWRATGDAAAVTCARCLDILARRKRLGR